MLSSSLLHRSRTITAALLVILVSVAPGHTQSLPREPSSLTRGPAAGFAPGSLDPRLIPPLRRETDQISDPELRWPQDPAVGGLLGSIVGCAAGYALFYVFSGPDQNGNSAGWGCILGAVLGMGIGNGEISGR